jgi:hypothetical protein
VVWCVHEMCVDFQQLSLLAVRAHSFVGSVRSLVLLLFPVRSRNTPLCTGYMQVSGVAVSLSLVGWPTYRVFHLRVLLGSDRQSQALYLH